jgi:hypothetical protein
MPEIYKFSKKCPSRCQAGALRGECHLIIFGKLAASIFIVSAHETDVGGRPIYRLRFGAAFAAPDHNDLLGTDHVTVVAMSCPKRRNKEDPKDLPRPGSLKNGRPVVVAVFVVSHFIEFEVQAEKVVS